MTPYQFSRASPRQRMLAGLNTLGFAIPPTMEAAREAQRAGTVQANLAVDLKRSGATVATQSAIPTSDRVATAKVAAATAVAPAGTFKTLIASTWAEKSVGSGIDGRASSAQALLTPSADTLNLREGSLTALPPKSKTLPGSTINPTRPGIVPNPFEKVDPRLERAMDATRFSTERTTKGADLVQSTRPKADPVGTSSTSTNESDGRSTNVPPVTSTPDPRSSFTDSSRPPIRDDGALRPDAREREPLDVLPDPGTMFPELNLPQARRPFPVGMAIAGVGVVGFIAYMLLRK